MREVTILMNNTIIIEAFNINSGGAKELLLYLINYVIENTNHSISVSLQDSLMIDEIHKINSERIKIIKVNKVMSLIRLFKKREHVIFFGNLPPFVKCNNSILYIHNMYLALSSKELINNNIKGIKLIKLLVMKAYIRIFHNKVSFVFCQTLHMQQFLLNNMKVNSSIMPFYDDNVINKACSKLYDFCYVGLPSSHKNHIRLLEAVELLINKGYVFKIAITVPDRQEDMILKERIKFINSLKDEDTILNKGHCSKQEINEIYLKSKTLVFPSLLESFGLPVIEGKLFGLRIIASDLPYIYDLISNPIVFDPYSVKSITDIMEDELKGKYNKTNQNLIIKNEVKDLVSSI